MSLSIYQLKPKFQQLLRPLLQSLIRHAITPNQVTLLALVLALVYGTSLFAFSHLNWLWWCMPPFLLLRMGLNAIDGMLANASGQKTLLGALLNEICDQISDVVLYLPFVLLPGINPALLVAVVIAALLAEFAGALAPLIGVARRFDGPMGKSDRAFVFSILAMLGALGVGALWLNGVLVLVLLLAIWTMINRLRQALRLAQAG